MIAACAVSDAEAIRVLLEVRREYAKAAWNGEGTGQQITGPPRPSHWLTPSARARQEAVQLGQGMMPRDRRQPHGSAVTVTPLPAEARPPGWAEDRRCSSGHQLHSEAATCGICGSGAVFDESSDPPLPPSRYPAELGLLGGR